MTYDFQVLSSYDDSASLREDIKIVSDERETFESKSAGREGVSLEKAVIKEEVVSMAGIKLLSNAPEKSMSKCVSLEKAVISEAAVFMEGVKRPSNALEESPSEEINQTETIQLCLECAENSIKLAKNDEVHFDLSRPVTGLEKKLTESHGSEVTEDVANETTSQRPLIKSATSAFRRLWKSNDGKMKIKILKSSRR